MSGTIRLDGIDVAITYKNKRERHLIGIAETMIEMYVGYLQHNDKGLGDYLREEQSYNWMIVELSGIFSAMFFMKMLPKPVSSVELWNCILALSRQ